ncbi:PREDICTED: prosaposin-like isoform X2 [Wasmannia auropunctata]|nr:PREDICTED: prosaposin-like isoform X2 [Wasmannia auropunctata]
MMTQEQSTNEVAIDEEHLQSEAEKMQLPLERLMPFPLLQPESINGTRACTLCEYFMLTFLYIDTNINPTVEMKVRESVEKICARISPVVQGECQEFMNTYEDAVVSILVQKIDPSLVCSVIRICPSDETVNMWEEIPKHLITTKRNKPDCPFCLLAITQIYNVIKDNITEANIQTELDKLCDVNYRLPRSLTDVCTDFMNSYRQELASLLFLGLSIEDICNFVHLCTPTDDPTQTD